ncbi:MAG: hypothetical protein AB8C02_15670 [Halioglobus sp.]
MFKPNQPVPTHHVAGAMAASLAASCFVVGFTVYATLLVQSGYADLGQNPAGQVQFMMAHEHLLQMWYGIIYLLFGVCLAVLVPVLRTHVCYANTLLVETASIFGLIWSALVLSSGLLINVGMEQITTVYMHSQTQASTLWQALYAVLEGLGGGNELVGGLWILLISLAARREVRFEGWLSLTGIIVGAAGVCTTLPGLQGLEAIFGLGAIVWFGGIAVSILNSAVDQ